ncbi:cellulase family glycosylhydrolase [Halalkalibacter urbisdiaboli]|uniref:cellulase family glycosylhydrolase n=1 Tax=Halalkalibacter urbisdiaboli TaxID=1960589 RepID=UPI000B440E79|nr:cellulase family glycosylhydrolase [Halalkalibacter urbisdiaboli]
MFTTRSYLLFIVVFVISLTLTSAAFAAYPSWSPDEIYNSGDKVLHQERNWEAQWWTRGEEPGTTGQWGVWQEVEGETEQPDPTEQPEPTESHFVDVDPMIATKNMSPGWNLGNSLDAIPYEFSWNNDPVEEQTIDDIKNSGFNSIRVPVTWNSYIGSAPNYEVDSEWMDRVEEVVDWVLERDMYVVLNVHHDSWQWIEEAEKTPEGLAKFYKLWEQIAERFKDKNEKLIFEVLNEPVGFTAQETNATNEDILNIIRTSGGFNDQRLVMIGGFYNDTWDTVEGLAVPNDQRLIVTVHNYNPWDFVSNWWGKVEWGSEEDKQVIYEDMKVLYDTYVSKGIPVVIGEFGTLANNEPFSKWVYNEYLVRTAYQFGMTTMFWDNGEHFNRGTSQWRDEVLKEMIVHAGLGTSNSFVKPARLYVNTQQATTDEILQLELNGNQLIEVATEMKTLQEGTDYTYNKQSNEITLLESFMSDVTQSSQLGVAETLKFTFSEGASQTVDIVQYDEPELSQYSFTLDKSEVISEDLQIPASLNGTELATVRAIVDSSGAPVLEEQWSWTPYTNYQDDFYSMDGDLYLTSRFLNYIEEDSTITFEFFPLGIEVDVTIKVSE